MKNKLHLLFIATSFFLFLSACKPDPIIDQSSPSGIDGGTLIASFPNTSIKDIHFLDQRIGFVYGLGEEVPNSGAYTYKVNRFFTTTDSMKTWQDYSLQGYSAFMSIKMLNKDFIYGLVFDDNKQGYFCYSTDYGKNWIFQDFKSISNIIGIYFFDILMITENEGFLCVYDSGESKDRNCLYKTTDAGKTWNKVLSAQSRSYSPSGGIVQASDGTLITHFLGNDTTYLFSSHDNGSTWINSVHNGLYELKLTKSVKDQEVYGINKSKLYSVQAPNGSAVGSYGQIIRYNVSRSKFDTLASYLFNNITHLCQYSNRTGLFIAQNSIAYSSNTYVNNTTVILDDETTLPTTSWLFTEKDFIIGTSKGSIYRYNLK